MKKLLVKWFMPIVKWFMPKPVDLAKQFMPKPADLAKLAAKAAADFVNSSGKEQAIQAFVEKTQKLREAQSLVTKWLADGKIDESEVAELEAILAPIAQELYDKVLEKVG